MSKKILSCVLLFVILSAMMFGGFVNKPNTGIASAEIPSDYIAQNKIDEIQEQEKKIYSSVTLEDEFADDIISVVLAKSATQSFKTYTEKDFPEIHNIHVEEITASTSELVKTQLNLEKMSRNNFDAKQMRFNTETYRRILHITLQDKGKANVLRAIKQLEKRDDVLSASPSYPGSICATPSEYDSLSSKEKWGLDRINMQSAWNISTGFDVTVAVIDSGIDATHNDLKNKISSIPSVDYIGNNALSDSHGHGTHVAGIIGAEANDGGAVGVAWNAKLVSLRVFDAKGEGGNNYGINLIKAINYASEKNIPIINHSGGDYINFPNVEFAIRNYTGLFVAAAGNDGNDNDSSVKFYPASYDLPKLISVSSTMDSDDSLRYYKHHEDCWNWPLSTHNKCKWVSHNYGEKTVDLYAPGHDIYSTLPNNKYDSWTGSSMAAPHVAGVAALIKSKYLALHAVGLKAAIMAGVDKVSALSNRCVSGGRLNAYQALQKAEELRNVIFMSDNNVYANQPVVAGNYATAPPTPTKFDHNLKAGLLMEQIL